MCVHSRADVYNCQREIEFMFVCVRARAFTRALMRAGVCTCG